MSRPVKYQTADDLLDNCRPHNDCYLWPESASPIPMLGPNSPIAKQFGTVSVVRILYVLCRYIPMGKRLVRKCNQPNCVNPFHHTEAQVYMNKRAKLANPNGLFPQQEDSRHLLAPPDEVLDKMRPANPVHIKRLMDAASIAGYEGDGLNDERRYVPPKHRKPNFAPVDAPVLVMKGFVPTPATQEPEVKQEWDEFESGLFAKHKVESLPEVRVEADEVDHDGPTNDIFEAIRRRKEWEAKK